MSRSTILLLLSCLFVTVRISSAQETPKPATAESALARPVVIGASVSDGFCIDEPMGGPRTCHYRFGRYLDAALAGPHGEIRTHANALFFVGPATVGESLIAKALEEKPTVIVAVDFLFWFCYGRLEEEARLPMLDAGLELLEKFECPIVVGDIPDAAAAAGGILAHEQVPQPQTIAAANRRIQAWAAGRKNVTIVPLAEFMKNCQADTALKVRDREWPAGESRKLLQRDRLHPARHGCAALALAVCDRLHACGVVPEADQVCWNDETVYKEAIAAADAAKPAAPAGKDRRPSGSKQDSATGS